MIIAVIVSASSQTPGLGLHGRSLGVTLSLVLFALALTVVIRDLGGDHAVVSRPGRSSSRPPAEWRSAHYSPTAQPSWLLPRPSFWPRLAFPCRSPCPLRPRQPLRSA